MPNTATTTVNEPPQVHPRLHGGQNYEKMGEPVYGGDVHPGQYHNQGVSYDQEGESYPPGANAYVEYPHRPPTPPSPSDRSNSPPPQHREPGKLKIDNN